MNMYTEEEVKAKIFVFLHLKEQARNDNHVYPADYEKWINDNFHKTISDI